MNSHVKQKLSEKMFCLLPIIDKCQFSGQRNHFMSMTLKIKFPNQNIFQNSKILVYRILSESQNHAVPKYDELMTQHTVE